MTMVTKHLRVLGWSVKTTITARCQETLMFERWRLREDLAEFFYFKMIFNMIHDFDLMKDPPPPPGFHPLGNQCYSSVRNCWWLPPFSNKGGGFGAPKNCPWSLADLSKATWSPAVYENWKPIWTDWHFDEGMSESESRLIHHNLRIFIIYINLN